MKKLCAFWLFLVTALGFAFGQKPISEYTFELAKNAYLTPPGETSVLAENFGSETLDPDAFSATAFTENGRVSISTTQSSVSGIAFGEGLAFQFGTKAYTHFVPTSDGLIFFGDEEQCTTAAIGQWGLIEGCEYIGMPMTVHVGQYNTYKARVNAQETTKVHYWKTDNNIVVIEFANFQVSNSYDETTEEKLITCNLTYQIQLDLAKGDFTMALKEVSESDFSGEYASISANESYYLVWGYSERAPLYVRFVLRQDQIAKSLGRGDGDSREIFRSDKKIETIEQINQGFAFSSDSLPEADLGVKFIAPEVYSCIPPEDIVFHFAESSWETVPTATKYAGRISMEGEADGFIVVLTKNDQLLFSPESGKSYKEGAVIDDEKILVNRTQTYADISVNDLESLTDYKIYAIPYNAYCKGGPLYGNVEELESFTTLSGAPEFNSVEVEGSEISLSLTPCKTEGVLVAWSSSNFKMWNLMSDWNPKIILKGVYEVGDVLYANEVDTIRVLYAGEVSEEALKMENAAEGKSHYFWAWSYSEEHGYSQEYATADPVYIAVTDIPAVFQLYPEKVNDDIDIDMAAQGWGGNEFPVTQLSWVDYSTFNGDKTTVLGTTIWSDSKIYVDLPVFTTTKNKVEVGLELMLWSPWEYVVMDKMNDLDTIFLWTMQWEEGSQDTAKTVTYFTSETVFSGSEVHEKFSHVDVVLNLDPTKKVLLRIQPKNGHGEYDSPYGVYLKRVSVDEYIPCSAPEMVVAVEDSLMHKSAYVRWTSGYNLEMERAQGYLYSYVKGDENVWSDPVYTTDTATALNGLDPYTTYRVRVRSVCSDVDSSNWRMGRFTTLRGIPYHVFFNEEKNGVPEGFAIYKGDGDEGYEAQEPDDYNTWSNRPNNKSKRTLSVNAAMEKELVTFPVLIKDEGPALMTFKTSMYSSNPAGSAPVTGLEGLGGGAKLQVLVSPTGEWSDATTEVVGEVGRSRYVLDQFVPVTVDLSKYSGNLYVGLLWTGGIFTPDDDVRSQTIEVDSVFFMEPECSDITSHKAEADITTASISWESEGVFFKVRYKKESADKFDSVTTKEKSVALSKLTPDTKYVYEIVSFADEMMTFACPGSVQGEFTTLRQPCDVPASFKVSVKDSSATFTFVTLADNIVLRVTGPDYAKDFAAEANEGSYKVENLKPGDYEAKVRAVCGAGDSSAWTSPLEFTIEAPVIPEPECGVPTELKSTVDKTNVSLTWKAGENNVSFEVRYKEASGSEYATETSDKAECSLTDLKPETVYVWSVKGICAEGISSEFAEDAQFETKGTANGEAIAAALRVVAQQGVIHVFNPGKMFIDRVALHTVSGQLILDRTVRSDNNVSIPLEGGRIVLLSVYSGGERAVYKVYVR